VTPLRDEGAALDEQAFAPLVDFLAAGGLDGVFALGTTGEGILLSVADRRRAAALFIEASAGRLPVVVQCGAQTTSETVELAAHAAEIGADGIAVIPPPYYALDEDELLGHLAAAARACAPAAFFAYEFAARSGYAIPLSVVERLRAEASNLAGLKVSDTPFDAVEPYLVEGLDVFVGSEPLFEQAFARGAVGSVSGLAAAFPELIAAHVHAPRAATTERVTMLREAFSRLPFSAAMKVVVRLRGVPVREDVRAPLRRLTPDERAWVERMLPQWLESPSPAPAR
jgi:dihydrodipicolinate synthase/N-acetylneuraminate lyase